MAVISGDNGDDDSDMMMMVLRTPGGVPQGRQSAETPLLSGPGRPGPGPEFPLLRRAPLAPGPEAP